MGADEPCSTCVMQRALVVIALGFAVIAACGVSVWWRVVSSPGDDNPIGGLAFLVAIVAGALALASGLVAALLARRG
ncbi:MAG: disulfide bond formation protein B [Myxococcaceae bacterium]|nr:disulfide bond formation protein B [Myxococcaceae bacterium]